MQPTSQASQRANGTRRRIHSLVALLLLILISWIFQRGESFMNLGNDRQTATSRATLSDGTSGKIVLDQFSCAQDPDVGFVNIDFLAIWTDKTREKSHSTLVHVGETEAKGIRLDLGQSTTSGDLSYYLVVGSPDETSGYRVEEFPLTKLDNQNVQVSLLVTRQAYRLQLRTNSGKIFQSQGESATIDCRAIYVGDGPPGLVPGFTDVALYPSETFNTNLVVEQGKFEPTSRIGLPDSLFVISQWLFRAALVALVLLLISFALRDRQLLLSRLQSLRNIDPKTTFVVVCLGLWTAVLPAWWIQSQFQDIPVSAKFSYDAADGHCDSRTQGIGKHCFGDYYQLVDDLSRSLSYEVHQSNYPPIGLLIHVITTRTEEFLKLGPRGGLAMYLTVCIAALMAPSIFLLQTLRGSYRFTAFFLVGISSLPSLIALDRGNNVAFVVPFLLAFGVYAARRRYVIAALALAFGVAFKPLLFLAFVFFVGIRHWRALLLGLSTCATISIIGFVLWPGDRLKNVLVFAESLRTSTSYQAVSQDYPANLSASRGLFQMLAPMGVSLSYVYLMGPILLICVVATLILRSQNINGIKLLILSLSLPLLVSTVTFAYYLVVLLPLVAVFLSESEINSVQTEWATLQIIAVSFAVSLVPLPISISDSGISISPHFTGLNWLLVCIVILIRAWIPRSKKREERRIVNLVN